MRITVINGNARHGSTWNCKELFCKETVHNMEKTPYPLIRGFMFKMMAGMQKGNDWNPVDRKHWEEKGWLSGERPY